MLPRLGKCTVLQLKRERKRSKNCEKEWDEMESIIESKEHQGLCIDEIRKMKNYENISDEQAQEIIFAIKNLAVIFYEHLNQKKKDQELKIVYNKAA